MKDIEIKTINRSSNSLVYAMYMTLINLVCINPDDLYMGVCYKQEQYSSVLLNKYDMLTYLEQMYIETNGQIEYKIRYFMCENELINILRNDGKYNYILLPALKGVFTKLGCFKKKIDINTNILWLLLYSDDIGNIKGVSQPYLFHNGKYMSSEISKIYVSNNSLNKVSQNNVANICYLLKNIK